MRWRQVVPLVDRWVEDPRRRRWTAVAAWSLAVVSGVLQFAYSQRHHSLGLDFRPLYLAGRAVLDGQQIYAVPAFVYPPTAALLGVLLAPLPMTTWIVVDLAVEVVVLMVLAAVTVRWLVPPRWQVPAGGVAAAVLVWSHPSAHSLWLANVSVLVAAAGLGVVVLWGRDRWLAGCLLLMASLLVKPLLVPLVLVPLLLRRVRPLLVAGAGAGLVLLVSGLLTGGLGELPRVADKLLHGSVLVGRMAKNNLALSGLVESHHWPVAVGTAGRVAVVAGVAWLLVAAVRRRPAADVPALACLSSTLLLGLLLAGSLSEVHYLFAVLPGGFAALALRRTRPVRVAVGLAAVGVFFPVRHGASLFHQELLVLAEVGLFVAGLLVLVPGLDRSEPDAAPAAAPGPQVTGRTDPTPAAHQAGIDRPATDRVGAEPAGTDRAGTDRAGTGQPAAVRTSGDETATTASPS